MSAPVTDEAVARRAQRRRHLHQRQTVIFGTLVTILAVLGLGGLGVFTGLLPAPFDPAFESRDPSAGEITTPCPADDATAIALSAITVNVYNSTTTSGLAGRTAEAFTNAGLLIGEQANYTGAAYTGTARIIVGADAIDQAYSVAALIPSAVVVYSPAKVSGGVDVVLGSEFSALADPAENALDPANLLETPPGCTELPENATV